MSPGKFTRSLADFIQGLSYDQLPEAAISASKRSILDCLGVAVAGSSDEASKLVIDYVRAGSKLEAGVIAGGFKASMDEAAWANGTMAHALDYDDYFTTSNIPPYHPTVAILPAILAVGEKLHVSGRDLLLAYIAGFEVEARIAAICAEPSYKLGWHTTSTLGSLAAAAAVSKLLKLENEKIRMALGIAASLAGGTRRNFGTMTKPLQAGNAARSGVVSALLAERGLTADRDAFDGPGNLCDLLTGQPDASATRDTREDLYILSPGIALKPYPSCAYTHWAIDATLSLRKEPVVIADKIATIECHTSTALPEILIHSRPTSAAEGKFSLEFCVAIALLDGEVTLGQFTDDRVTELAVQELIKKVGYVHPPEMGTGLDYLGGKVVIRLKNGEVYSRQVDKATGDPANPMSTESLVKKYTDCCRPHLHDGDIKKSLDLLFNLESLSDIAELMQILAVS